MTSQIIATYAEKWFLRKCCTHNLAPKNETLSRRKICHQKGYLRKRTKFCCTHISNVKQQNAKSGFESFGIKT